MVLDNNSIGLTSSAYVTSDRSNFDILWSIELACRTILHGNVVF